LFGHIKGAFTGAIKDKVGRFQRADGGTLFLDEIGDISLRMQTRLLRVIETMEFERVGDSNPIRVDVRIITATNRDLRQLVAEGKFRKDLYYRLKVVEIPLPPLRERRDDIPLLVNHFLAKFKGQFNNQIRGISADALAMFLEHEWPGNIRELENTMEYAFVCCHDEIITTAHLPADFHCQSAGMVRLENMDEQQESKAIHQALEKSRWNKSKAADLMGFSRRTMYRKMKKHGFSQA
jgi:two-component system, NtrC family, response regulator HydG